MHVCIYTVPCSLGGEKVALRLSLDWSIASSTLHSVKLRPSPEAGELGDLCRGGTHPLCKVWLAVAGDYVHVYVPLSCVCVHCMAQV